MCQQKLQLGHESACLVLYSPQDNTYCLDSLYCQLGLAKIRYSMSYNKTHDICEGFSGAPEFQFHPSKNNSFAKKMQAQFHIRTEVLNTSKTVFIGKWDWQLYIADSVITRLLIYVEDSPVNPNFDHMPAKAAEWPRISERASHVANQVLNIANTVCIANCN